MLDPLQLDVVSNFFSRKSGSIKCVVKLGVNSKKKHSFWFATQQELEVFKTGIALAVGFQEVTVDGKLWD